MDLIAGHVLELLYGGPDAVVIVDAHGNIAFVNAQTLTLFGYQREALLGRPVEVLMPEQFGASHPTLLQWYRREPQVRPMGASVDLYAQRSDGSQFPVEISLNPLHTKDGLLISTAIRDITDRKLVYEQLVSARTEAERANRAKSSFLAAASHNLRQPLQTLTLLNSVLEKTVLDPPAARAIAAQRAALASVSGLLNALLDISKLESGAIKPDISDCSVQAIFKRLKATFEAQAHAKGLSLLVDDAEHIIRTDKGLFEQIIQNLVANAIRYTRTGMVQLRCLHDAAFVRVEVLDTGIGIAANQKDAIFDEFFQLDSSTGNGGEKRDGLGLGLAIVRRITQLLGHSIEVNSEIGRGSCFSVTVPRGHESALHAPQHAAPLATARGSKAMIMVIDDDEAVAGATKMLLKLDGYRVHVASSLEDALALKEDAEAWPDVIVSDYHLANGISGIDAIVHLRTLAQRFIPAVLVTGDTSSDVYNALEQVGNCEVLSKPFVPNEFLEVVNRLLATNVSIE
jgi:PAS domain S-box-containing protein